MTTTDSHGTSRSYRTERQRIGPREETDELRENIAHTREELGATIAALAQKTDVKARAKDKAAQMRSNVTIRARHAAAASATRRGAAVTVVGAGAGTVALQVWRRRRARKPTKWQLALQTGQQTCGKVQRNLARALELFTGATARPPSETGYWHRSG